MRSSKARWTMIGMTSIIWTVMAGVALAADKAAATTVAAKPSGIAAVWDQAINSISLLINWVANWAGHDYGLALIIVTVFIRLLTMPLMLKSLRNTKKMQTLQPRMAELKAQYGKEPQQYQQQVMALYKSENVNPFAGCMPMIIQMVVLMILYRGIYTDQAMLHSSFLIWKLGVPDPTYILPVLAGATSFLQQKVSMVQTDPSQKLIMYIFPVMIFFLALHYLAALALYWVFSNLFTIVQMYFIRRPAKTAGA